MPSSRRVPILLAIIAVLLAVLGGLFFKERATNTIRRLSGMDDGAAAHVLFIGNSFTFVNDLPELLRSLAAADGMTIAVTMHATPGTKLREHAADSYVRELLALRWNYVVLQEQSQLPQLPTFDNERTTSTGPAIRALREAADRTGAKTVLYATWGYRSGDRPNIPNDSFESMQVRLDAGFAALSAEETMPLVPVGAAWAKAHRAHPDWNLWADDGKHPSLEGSYLAACVFYAALLHRSPVGNAFTAGLPKDHVHDLQEIAASVVP